MLNRSLLKLLGNELNDKELLELKQILTQFLSKKLIAEVDKIAEEKGYTAEILESWKDEHFRTPS